MSTFSPFP